MIKRIQTQNEIHAQPAFRRELNKKKLEINCSEFSARRVVIFAILIKVNFIYFQH